MYNAIYKCTCTLTYSNRGTNTGVQQSSCQSGNERTAYETVLLACLIHLHKLKEPNLYTI